MEKPNIVLVLVDQLRRDSVGHLGGPVRTPNIDRLAADGTTFTQAYCTYPMCTPARAALLTGRMPHALKDDLKGRPYFFNDRILDTSEVSIAKSLNEAGYDCAYFGKWHLYNDNLIPEGPARMGFDAAWAGSNAGRHMVGPDGAIPGPAGHESAKPQWAPEVELAMGLDYLERRKGSAKPFFLAVSWLPPHDPHELPEEKRHLFNEARNQIGEVRGNVPERLKEDATERYVGYHANVIGIDGLVGKLLDYLRENGLGKNTVVVFTSDHGDSLLSHGLNDKNQFYEEAAAIPFIIRWPENIRAGVRTDAFFNMIDIAPTLLGVAGLEIPSRMQGKCFAGLLVGRTDEKPWTSAYLEINHPWYDYRFGQGPQGNRRCLVTDEWKLVLLESKLGTGGAIPWQLFDRKNDPLELNNLKDDPGMNLVICDLVKEMWNWMAVTNDLDFYDLTLNGLKEA